VEEAITVLRFATYKKPQPNEPNMVYFYYSKEGPEVDRHPERRLKAAFAAFEEERLPQLKAEHPNMRLSQIKQLLWKEWLKSPKNPVNQKPPA
jgi:hypothetical protein